MTRRGFIAAFAAAVALDPEKLLWRPGEKLISIPAPRLPFYLEVGDVVTFAPWPERYIVTAAARSMHEIAAPRFRMISHSFADPASAGLSRWPESIQREPR